MRPLFLKEKLKKKKKKKKKKEMIIFKIFALALPNNETGACIITLSKTKELSKKLY